MKNPQIEVSRILLKNQKWSDYTFKAELGKFMGPLINDLIVDKFGN